MRFSTATEAKDGDGKNQNESSAPTEEEKKPEGPSKAELELKSQNEKLDKDLKEAQVRPHFLDNTVRFSADSRKRGPTK